MIAIQILYLHGSSITQQQGDKKLVLLLNNWKDGSCSKQGKQNKTWGAAEASIKGKIQQLSWTSTVNSDRLLLTKNEMLKEAMCTSQND